MLFFFEQFLNNGCAAAHHDQVLIRLLKLLRDVDLETVYPNKRKALHSSILELIVHLIY